MKWDGKGDDHVGAQLDEFFGEPPHENRIVRSPTVFQLKVSSIDPSEPAERALQRRDVGSCLRVSQLHQYPDPRYLLRSLSHGLPSLLVHPSMVVGLVSGTGAGLVLCSTTASCDTFAPCFVSNDSVCRPRFEVSCARPVVAAMVLADEPCTASRLDFAGSGGSASTFLTGDEVQFANPSQAKDQR
jgi:hypothetical protein